MHNSSYNELQQTPLLIFHAAFWDLEFPDFYVVPSKLQLPFQLVFRSLTAPKLTPSRCKRILPDKLTVPEVLKKFPEDNRTRRFIAVFTKSRHLFLSSTFLPNLLP
jgi:hypothetical protein